MKKFRVVAAVVLSLMFLCSNVISGELEPTSSPGPTMHSLDEIYNLIADSAVPRYQYWHKEFTNEDNVIIHSGSGVVHSIIITHQGTYSSYYSYGDLKLNDGDNTIGYLSFNAMDSSTSMYHKTEVYQLDIAYSTNFNINFESFRWSGYRGLNVTVVYLPDN